MLPATTRAIGSQSQRPVAGVDRFTKHLLSAEVSHSAQAGGRTARLHGSRPPRERGLFISVGAILDSDPGIPAFADPSVGGSSFDSAVAPPRLRSDPRRLLFPRRF